MNYSVNARQPIEIKKLADELKVQYRDIDYIFNLVEDYPTKRIVLEVPRDEELEESFWEVAQAHSEKLKGNFYLCLYSSEHCKLAREHGVRFYWGIPATTLYQLRGIKGLGCSFAIVAAPLAFQLPDARAVGIKLRMVPNMGFTDYIGRRDGIHGAWVRPEDVQLYEEYIDTFEFMIRDPSHERGLLHVYKGEKWNDDLQLLISGLNYSVANYMINPEEFTVKRLSCGQKCENGRSCHICESYLNFVNSAHSYLNLKNSFKKNSNE